MTSKIIRVIVTVVLILAWPSKAHEIRPALLQITETSQNVYGAVWKVPSKGDRVLDIFPQFSAGAQLLPVGSPRVLNGFVLYRYQITAQNGLAGAQLTVTNLEKTRVDALVNVRYLNGAEQSLLLQPKQPTAVFPAEASPWQIARTYTTLGFEHILLGIDHLLFVASLMLIVFGWSALIKTITAFTLAHSLSLALVTLGWVSLPSAPVEVMIAFSIVLVCVEAVRRARGCSSIAIRWPWLVAFAFGLLHGFGFAGALQEIGLPSSGIALALLFFNIGVELGQLLFVLVILLIAGIVTRVVKIPRKMVVAMAYAIGSVSAFWVIERLHDTFFV